MPNEDLFEHAKSSEDFYALLEINFQTSESDIRRAYRKTALKYHPDKRGAAFDPEKFHLLQIAYDVLSDPAAKAVYDQGRQAIRQKGLKDAAFEGKRRQMKEELEARERNGQTAFGGSGTLKRKQEEDNDEAVKLRAIREAGKRRRLVDEEKRRVANLGSEAPVPTAAHDAPPIAQQSTRQPGSSTPHQTAAEEAEEEDEVARLERRIKEAAEVKARRKAEKKARKSGVYVPVDSPAPKAVETPSKAPDRFSSLKADFKNSATPKVSAFATSPVVTPNPDNKSDTTGFAATMQRLRDAERKKLEEQIRKEEAAER